MGKAFYRTYRSKNFAEVIGQDHITQSLDNAITQGRISHAYLFTGPRGVGKTSVARILAHQITKLEYNETVGHLDIIEIDAASNRRIDEIRDLREKVHVSPALAKYKVYIIDEVHMLTKEAFNALLKTLEEPPAHVVFILATTEVNKLPETIVSRCQRFSFKPIAKNLAIKHLANIAKKENIQINSDALELLVTHGDGSFRDSISMLDQCSAMGTSVSRQTVEDLLGIAPEVLVTQVYNALVGGNATELITALQQTIEQGISAVPLSAQLAQTIRSKLLDKQGLSPQIALQVLDGLLLVGVSTEPNIKLELVLLQNCSELSNSNTQPIQISTPYEEIQIKQPKPTTVLEDTKQPEQKIMNTKQQEALTSEMWANVLAMLKKSFNTLYGVARMAKFEVQGDKIVLTVAFGLHQKKLSDSKNQKILKDFFYNQFGISPKIDVLVDTTLKNHALAISGSKDNNNINTISNIFGPSELLDS